MRNKFCAFIESFFGNVLGETSPSHIIIPSCNGFTPSGLICDKLNSPCEMLKPCENNASCTDDNTTSAGYVCLCLSYFNGTQCHYDHRPCKPVTCWNNGTCTIVSNTTFNCICEDGWHGRHCEITTTKIEIYKMVSKSFAYIAIIALIIVAVFIIMMDILKYCFDIDPVGEERKRIRRKKQAKKRKPVIQRFIYVNAPPPPTQEPVSTIAETTV